MIGWCKLDEFNETVKTTSFGGGHVFCFFSSPRKKEEGSPTHIAAHLQAHTSQRSNQRLAKELQFCRHTRANLLHLNF